MKVMFVSSLYSGFMYCFFSVGISCEISANSFIDILCLYFI